MEKEAAENFAKSLVLTYERQLKWILSKDILEILQKINAQIDSQKNSQLHTLIQDLLVDLTAVDKKKQELKSKPFPGEDISYYDFFRINLENALWRNFANFQREFIEHFITYNFLQLFLVRDDIVTPKYKKQLLKKHDLTPKKVKDLILGFLETEAFLGRIKQGGSEKSLDDRKRLELLALYNRYLIVIKNARKEKKHLKKQGKSETEARREALAKYKIPENLEISAFSDDAPSDTALDWAKETLQTNLSREYLKRLLNQTRNENRQWGYIVDVDFKIGRRLYGFRQKDKHKAELLLYPPIDKSLDEKKEFSEGFLICLKI